MPRTIVKTLVGTTEAQLILQAHEPAYVEKAHTMAMTYFQRNLAEDYELARLEMYVDQKGAHIAVYHLITKARKKRVVKRHRFVAVPRTWRIQIQNPDGSLYTLKHETIGGE